jgi:predicted nucleic acid-binding protein
MIVVADTAPLNYLILIGYIEVLEPLYGEVVIPPAVQEEMLSPMAPEPVRSWIGNPPRWLEVRTPGRIPTTLHPRLDDGEREAITLVQNSAPDGLLLINETLGRREAKRLGIRVTGTLGILEEAHNRGLLDLRTAIDRLRATSFNATDALLKRFTEM